MTLDQAREQMARAGYRFVAAVEYPGEPTRWQATFIPAGSADCLLDLYCLGGVLVGRFWPRRPTGQPDPPIGFLTRPGAPGSTIRTLLVGEGQGRGEN